MIDNINTDPVDLIDDNEYFYDEDVHRYRLRALAAKNFANIDWVATEGSEDGAKIKARRVSDYIYDMIRALLPKRDRDYLELRIALDQDLALDLKRIMLILAETDALNKIIEIGYGHGLDIGVTKEDMQKAQINSVLENALMQGTFLTIRYVGFPRARFRVGY